MREKRVCDFRQNYKIMIQIMSENDAIVSRYMDDADFQRIVFPLLAKNIYTSITKQTYYPAAKASTVSVE